MEINQLDQNCSEKIERFIVKVDDEFIPPLSSKVSIPQWSKKLNALAVNIAKVNFNGDLDALISFYPNKDKESYISFIAVGKSQRGKKLAGTLLDRCIKICTDMRSTSIKVHTWLSNDKISNIYHSRGFVDIEIINDRGSDKTLILEKKLC